MLTLYETALTNLLQAPSSPTALIPSSQLQTYINIARLQLALDAECIRALGAFNTVIGTSGYNFSSVTFINPGISGVGAIQNLYVSIGNNPIELRPWPWFLQYYSRFANTGVPTVASQQGQGALGTIVLYPTPDAIYNIEVDSVCFPINLVDDTTPEAIPYPWTDAVPFYAAWLAFMSLQRQADADRMFSRYKELAQRGRQESTSEVLPGNAQGGVGAAIAASKTTLTTIPPTALRAQQAPGA